MESFFFDIIKPKNGSGSELEDLINKYRGKSKTKKTEYTEEEEFYATLLQMKSDLDAEAFEASRDMLNEVFRHQRE